MAFGSQRSTLFLLATLALSLTACPAPTGRRRGPGDGGSVDWSCGFVPTPGSSCSNEGESCSSTSFCPGSRTSRHSTCFCTGGSWRCSVDRCGDAGRPDSAVECPSTPVSPGGFCARSETGQVCMGRYFRDCDGTTVRTWCECADGRWNCPEEPCRGDAGDVEPRPEDAGDVPHTDATDATDATDGSFCPPSPLPGTPCLRGFGCWYPGEGGDCHTYCNCEDDGRFACVGVPCEDGGASDASATD